jgi:hypothetical protein
VSETDVPRLATIDDDGWALLNAEERFARGEDLYWIPDRWIREHLEEHVPADGHAKLLFRVMDPTMPNEPAIERMWVTFAGRFGEYYHGHLANEPQTKGGDRGHAGQVSRRACD